MFKKLDNSKIINIINKIMDSNYTFCFIILMTLLANIFGIELITLYTYALLVVIGTLFCKDLRSLIPIAGCSYFMFSRRNNPLAIEKTSIFLNDVGKVNLIIVIVIVFIFAFTRLIFDIVSNKNKLQRPKLLNGYLLLGFGLVFGGIFSSYFSFKSFLFGLVEIAALSFSYFYFYYTVDFNTLKKDYGIKLLFALSILLSIEIIGMLITTINITGISGFNRGALYTGWGIYNNIGGMALFVVLGSFYYAYTKKSIFYYLYFLVSVLIIILSFSRNSIIGAILVFIVCSILLIINKNTRKNTLIVLGCSITILSIFYLIFKNQVNFFFKDLINVGLNDSGRFGIYINGFKQFLEDPIFGKGYYKCFVYRWGVEDANVFLPPRYHNTYIQLLASTGIIGFLCYLYHRYETILLLKYKTKEMLVYAGTILILICISLLDCHFFNIGPGFIYGLVLLFMEKNEECV